MKKFAIIILLGLTGFAAVQIQTIDSTVTDNRGTPVTWGPTNASGQVAVTVDAMPVNLLTSLSPAMTGTPTINGQSIVTNGASANLATVNIDTLTVTNQIVAQGGVSAGGVGTSVITNDLRVGSLVVVTNAAVTGQFGFTGFAFASLPTGVAAGYQTYCSDCITPWGLGNRVEWNGSYWMLTSTKLMATTDVKAYILSGVTNALNLNTPYDDVACAVVNGNSTVPPLGRSFANTSSGSYGFGSANAVGVRMLLSTATSAATGSARLSGWAFNAMQAGDTYALGGAYAVSAAPDGSDNYICQLGFSSTTSSNLIADGVFFLYDRWNATGHAQLYTNNWICVSVKTGSYTYSDSGLPVTASTTAADRLAIVASTTGASFYTNGVVCSTHNSTTIPTVALYANYTEILKTLGTGASRSLYEYNPWIHVRRATARTY